MAKAYALEAVLMIPFLLLNSDYVASNMTIFDGQLTKTKFCQYKHKGRHMLENSYNMGKYTSIRQGWDALASDN